MADAAGLLYESELRDLRIKYDRLRATLGTIANSGSQNLSAAMLRGIARHALQRKDCPE